MPEDNVIIIGGGAAAAHAAWPLVEAGRQVLMLDGGNLPPALMSHAPSDTYSEMRHSDAIQWQWFLGEDLSGIPVSGQGGLNAGQVSGNRAYVVRDAERELPLEACNATVIQSLAKGGLASAWGGTSSFLTKEDLTVMGMPPAEIDRHYDIITDRIGVSGQQTRAGIQPPALLDHHGEALLRASERKKSVMDRLGIEVSRPHAAMLTQDKNGRKAASYTDMDYWVDPGQSVYRPQQTIDELEQKDNFRYMGGMVVDRVTEQGGQVQVFTHSIHDREKRQTFSASRTIMAAGAVGSARLLLRSLGIFDRPTSFAGKPHTFVVCLHPRMAGKRGMDRRSSLCQLFIIDHLRQSGIERSCAQMYSYRSLQLFRQLGSVPLPEALSLLALMTPMLVIADVRFPGLTGSQKTLTLIKTADGNDRVSVSMAVNDDEYEMRRVTLKHMCKALRALGLLPVRMIPLPEAATHYAGTIPTLSEATDTAPLSVDKNGRLHQGNNIYVADAAVFRCLTPKPHTLTIMANANRIGSFVAATMA